MNIRNCLAGLTLMLVPIGETLGAGALQAQERDILDVAALENPLGTAVNEAQVRFGNPYLDGTELALHDVLPRPWTVTRILPLFEAAVANLRKTSQSRLERSTGDAWDASASEGMALMNEWSALAVHLGGILAASRDPRAARALHRVIESPKFLEQCSLASSFLQYFEYDPGYKHVPRPEGASWSSCSTYSDSVKQWWELNRLDVEKRADELASTAPPCAVCDQATEQVEQIHARLNDTAPLLRLSVEDGSQPRFVHIESHTHPASEDCCGSKHMQLLQDLSSDTRITIPGTLLGRKDLRGSALIISPGYRTVRIDFNTAQKTAMPVKLVPVASKTLTGTVTFTNGAPARPFAITVNLLIGSVNDPSGVFARNLNTLYELAETQVGKDGRFSLVIPDFTQDPVLNTAHNRFELNARDADLVLEPDLIDLDREADVELKLTASPVRRAGASGGSVP